MAPQGGTPPRPSTAGVWLGSIALVVSLIALGLAAAALVAALNGGGQGGAFSGLGDAPLPARVDVPSPGGQLDGDTLADAVILVLEDDGATVEEVTCEDTVSVQPAERVACEGTVDDNPGWVGTVEFTDDRGSFELHEDFRDGPSAGAPAQASSRTV